jgi:uncharacterized protein (DUF1697 family)
MKDLCRPFSDLGLMNVESVIASGNVVFEARTRPTPSLEARIERRLEHTLGYKVATFIRTLPELESIIADQPFAIDAKAPDAVVHVTFTRARVAAPLADAIAELTTDSDEACVRGREVYWLRRAPGKPSDEFVVRLAKLLGRDTTARNLKTVRRIVARYA